MIEVINELITDFVIKQYKRNGQEHYSACCLDCNSGADHLEELQHESGCIVLRAYETIEKAKCDDVA